MVIFLILLIILLLCALLFMFSERTKKTSTYLVHGLNIGELIRKVLVYVRDSSALA